jgi:hypothetical protein
MWFPANREFRKCLIAFLATVVIVSIVAQALFGLLGCVTVFVLAVAGGVWLGNHYGQQL